MSQENSSVCEDYSSGHTQLGHENQELDASFIFNIVPAASMPVQELNEADPQHFHENSSYFQADLAYYSGSGSDVSVSPSPSYQEFSFQDVEGLNNDGAINPHSDLDSPVSPYLMDSHMWRDGPASEFLHPGPALRHRRSHSTESSHSFRSTGSLLSPGPYFTPSSSTHSSMENLLDSLDISESKEELHRSLPGFFKHLSDISLPLDAASGNPPGVTAMSRAESSSLHTPAYQSSSIGFDTPTGVSIRDMLTLLTESGSHILSRDPEIIRQAFIQQLTAKGGRDNGANNFSKQPKMEIGTSATLRASESRRKTEASFFCDLCPAGFTRKNGLLNHYRSHLGIADKHCPFCRRGFTTSLKRHMKKCKSNPENQGKPFADSA